jgi:hypothetical protein
MGHASDVTDARPDDRGGVAAMKPASMAGQHTGDTS